MKYLRKSKTAMTFIFLATILLTMNTAQASTSFAYDDVYATGADARVEAFYPEYAVYDEDNTASTGSLTLRIFSDNDMGYSGDDRQTEIWFGIRGNFEVTQYSYCRDVGSYTTTSNTYLNIDELLTFSESASWIETDTTQYTYESTVESSTGGEVSTSKGTLSSSITYSETTSITGDASEIDVIGSGGLSGTLHEDYTGPAYSKIGKIDGHSIASPLKFNIVSNVVMSTSTALNLMNGDYLWGDCWSGEYARLISFEILVEAKFNADGEGSEREWFTLGDGSSSFEEFNGIGIGPGEVKRFVDDGGGNFDPI